MDYAAKMQKLLIYIYIHIFYLFIVKCPVFVQWLDWTGRAVTGALGEEMVSLSLVGTVTTGLVKILSAWDEFWELVLNSPMGRNVINGIDVANFKLQKKKLSFFANETRGTLPGAPPFYTYIYLL